MLNAEALDSLHSRQTVFSGWMAEPSPYIAELLAREGMPIITVDLQHSGVTLDHIISMFQAISVGGAVPFARVNWNEPGGIARVLDAGALGLICPMINTREQAEELVASTRYAPLGSRSYGPHRAALAYGSDYARRANESVVVLAMIETAEAVANLDEILSVDGLDGIYVGPSDLSQTMGFEAAPDWTEGPVLAAIEGILTTANAHGKIAGINTNSASYATRMAALGYHFITVPSEIELIRQGVRSTLKEINR